MAVQMTKAQKVAAEKKAVALAKKLADKAALVAQGKAAEKAEAVRLSKVRKFTVSHPRIPRMHHPVQNVYIYPGEAVELELDNFLQCQIDAGLIVEVK
jgi:hypothetical protein